MLSVAERAAEVMEHLCTHSAHGYSQPNRAGVGTGGVVGETITLSDGTKVGISAGDRDCSSACVECYAALGVDCGGASYTGNMRSCMVGTGNFVWHPWGTYAAKRGDIYLNESHHTAMCLGNGKLGEFSRSELHSTHGAKGDQDGWESHVTSFYTYSKGWDGVLEYVGPEPEQEDEVTDQDKEEIALKVWNMVLDGCGGEAREAWRMLSEAAREATRTDDPSGRGVSMTDHAHLKYVAAKQAEMAERQKEMYAMLDALVSALEGFVPAVEGGATD